MESDPLATLTFLYEDNHVLAVDKPAGMLSQADLTGADQPEEPSEQ